MTDRWLNYVLSVFVVLGLAGVAIYTQPRDREERAEFLDQDLSEAADVPNSVTDRDPIELRRRDEREDGDADGDSDGDGDGGSTDDPLLLDTYGVSTSHPEASEVGMQVLEAGGNAIDAAIAVAYALGVAEPFGSGIGGGGAMLVQKIGEDARSYDYREIAPASSDLPPSDIGVPGFVAGMETIHDEHGSVELPELIEYAVRLAEDGVEVDEYLHDRLRGAAYRMPIHLLPDLFPDGSAVPPGEVLHQPEYATALRLIQEDGSDAMYQGQLAKQITEAVTGLEMEDFAGYEVMEVAASTGDVAGYQIVSSGPPTSGAPLVQLLQIADAGGITELELDSADAVHLVAQAWRTANDQRSMYVADPSQEDVDLSWLVSEEHTSELASLIPDNGFVTVEDEDDGVATGSDTTHAVVIDREGTIVSMTNTLSNFFGSGLPVSGFFLNDQLKNFNAEPDSINHVAPGKRPRSFIAPTIVLDGERPVLGIGSPGGRRIPNMIGQVLLRWMVHGESLEDAVLAPRLHLEGNSLELEEALDDAAMQQLAARGYEVTTEVATSEYFGGVQTLAIDWEDGVVYGVQDPRRGGNWDAGDGAS